MSAYSRLEPVRKEVRLLRLWSRQECLELASDEIHCSMLTVSLFKPPAYDALSYTWGDGGGAGKSIIVDGHSINVAENLHCALGRIQKDSLPYTIWVDSVCINQSDASEKGSKVALMGELFGMADRVIFWLGEGTEDSDLAMDTLAQIGEDSADLVDMQANELESVTEKCLSSHDSDLEMMVEGSMEFLYHWVIGSFGDGWEFPLRAITELIRRRWWRRLWVLQELVLAGEGIFLCGSKTIDERCLIAAWTALDIVQRSISRRLFHMPSEASKHEKRFMSAMAENPARSMLLYRKRLSPSYRGSKQLPLNSILRLTLKGQNGRDAPNFEVTDPRDRIFGLLGIASDNDILNIRPSYRCSCREAYTATAISLLQQGHLSVLDLNQFPKRFTVLPSWVPDWSCPLAETLQLYERPWHTAEMPVFRSAGVRAASLKIFKSGPSETILSIGGIRVDTVKQTGLTWQEQWPKEEEGGNLLEKGFTWLERLFQLCSKRHWKLRVFSRGSIEGPEYGTESQWQIALLRVSTGGQITEPSDGRPRKMRKDDALRLLGSSDAFGLPADDPIVWEYMLNVSERAYNRRPFLTSKGYLGLGPADIRKGDTLVIFGGSGVPYILRPSGKTRFQLLGDAYVEGIMDGEIMREDPEFQSFELV